MNVATVRRGLTVLGVLMFLLAPSLGISRTVQAAPAQNATVASVQMLGQYGDINTGGNVGNTCVAPDGHGPVTINCGDANYSSDLTLSGDTNNNTTYNVAPSVGAPYYEIGRKDGYCDWYDVNWNYLGKDYC